MYCVTMSSAVSLPETEPKMELLENFRPSQFVKADPLAVNFNLEDPFVPESELKLEVPENLGPPESVSDPLAVNFKQENFFVPESELKMEVFENMVPSGLFTADPLAVNLNQENLANILSNSDLKTPIHPLVPVLKLEPQPESSFKGVVEFDFLSNKSCRTKDIFLHTDLIRMKEDFAGTTVSYETSAGATLSRSFFITESLAGNSVELNNERLTGELIIGNCDAPILPVRESLASPDTSLQTAHRLSRIVKVAPNVSSLIRGKGVKKSRYGFQIVNEKVGVGVLDLVSGKECLTRSSVEMQVFKKTCKFMGENSNASDKKRITKLSTRLKGIGQAGEPSEDILNDFNVKDSERCHAYSTASDTSEQFTEFTKDNSSALNLSSSSSLNFSEGKGNRQASGPAVNGLNNSNLSDSARCLPLLPTSSQIMKQTSKSARGRQRAVRYSVQRTTSKTENLTVDVVIGDQDVPAAINPECLKTEPKCLQVLKNNPKKSRIVYTCLDCSPHKHFDKKSVLIQHIRKFHISRCIVPKRQQNCPKMESGVISKDVEESSNGTSVANRCPIRIILIRNNENNQSKFLIKQKQPGQHTETSLGAEHPSAEENMNCQTLKSCLPEISSALDKNRKNQNKQRKSKKLKTALSHLESVAALANKHLNVSKVNLSSHLMSRKQDFLQDKIHFIPSIGWGCDICGKFYTSRFSLKEHKKVTHYQLNEFLCQTCQKVFKSINEFRRHEINCHTHLYKCSVCEKSYAKRALYERHFIHRHASPVVYTCLECSPHKHFDNKPDLHLHITTRHVDNYIFPCKTCGKSVTNKKMVQHMRTHDRDNFTLMRSIENQLKTYTVSENATFTCMFCRKLFDVKLQLINHLVEVHVCSVLELSNSEKPVFYSIAGTQGVQTHLQTKRNVTSGAIEERQQNWSQKKPVGISEDAQESSSGGTLVTANGFPMPIILTSKNQNSQSRFISKENQPSQNQNTESICGEEQSSAEESTKCDTVKSIVPETSSISENTIVKEKLTELEMAASRVHTDLKVVKVTLSSHHLSRKQTVREDEIHYIRGVGWGCDICGMFYTSRQRIKEHKKHVHYRLNEFVCSTCQMIFSSTDKFKMHENNCGTHRYKCPDCGKLYGKMVRYEEHYKLKHKPLVVYTCSECSPHKHFDKKSDLYFHVKTRHVNKYVFPCKACGKPITHEKMAKHLRTHDRKNLQCCHCGKHFTAARSLKEHLKTHDAIFPCQFCERGFKLKPELVKHLKEHENKRSFICEHCGKSFFTKAHLSTHLKIHQEKEFICAKCNRGFVLKHQLTAHLGTIACGVNSKTSFKRMKKTKNAGKRKRKQK